ncbi:MAG: glycosyltransferase family 4 protein [Desulfomonilia bacterium]|nr:glycosyltransferase family 4 protein [Desulfomonilia bacterium]
MKLALLIPTLNGGGAERVLSTMANYWSVKGHVIHLLTHDSIEKDFYPLHDGVFRHGWDISRPPRHPLDTIQNNILRITLPRKDLVALRPDAAISFTVRMNAQNLIALLGTGIPIIVSERNNPLVQKQPFPFEFLRRHLYPRASALVVQTDAARRWATSFMPKGKIHVIPNPLSFEDRDTGVDSSFGDSRVVCSAGRLIPNKGFDLLIRSFYAATRDRHEWSLLILGEGEERPRLEELIRKCGLQDRVHLPGRVKNPNALMKSSTIFVLPSRHEGFPNALIEAMALGLPVISTDCPFGPSEIIRHGFDGLLVPNGNEHELTRAIEYLMTSDEEKTRLGNNARESSGRFSLDPVMHRWESLLSSLRPSGRGPSA